MAQIDTWYDILNVLVSYEKIKETELRDIVRVSLPTLKKELTLLKGQLESVLKINKINDYYLLEIIDYTAFESIMNGELKQETDFNSVKKRVAYILKRLIDTNDYLLIDDLAQELETSRGTVTRDLKEIKKVIEKFGVSISGTPNKGLKIEGNEFDIRLLYLHHVYDYYPSNYFIPNISSYMTTYSLENNIPTNSVNTWKKVLEITLMRIHQQHQLNKPIPHYTNYQWHDESFDQLIYQIESLYEMTLSQYDIDFISFPLNISNTGAVEKVYMNEPFIREIFDQMMQHVSNLMSVEFDEEELYTEMRFHLLYLLNRLIFRIDNYDYFYGELEKKYPFAYEVAKVAMEKIEEIIGRQSSEAEISYLAVYFELMMKKNRPQDKKIAIVCNTGKGTANLMKQQINQVLGSHIKLETYTEIEYQEIDLSNYFAVFTTIPLKNIDDKIPLIRITNLFNDEWLHSEWRRVNKMNQLQFEHVDFSFTHMKKASTYHKQLSQMIEVLRDKKQVDAQFEGRIIEREHKQTTVFGNGIAFPHALNKGNNRIVFHLGVLGNKCSSDEEIRFIFMVGIPQEMTKKVEAELLQLYDNMLRITSDKEKSKELYELNSSEEFYDWLWKEVV